MMREGGMRGKEMRGEGDERGEGGNRGEELRTPLNAGWYEVREVRGRPFV